MIPTSISKPSSTPTPTFLGPYLHRDRDLKARAEIYHGDEKCREKFILLLTQVGLPNGLLIIEEIEEYGYVKDTGFVWFKHKKKREYYRFENTLICYEPEVTAYLQPNKIRNLTGVKAREYFIWITLSEIYVNDRNNSGASITFRTPSGLSKSFPLSLFQCGTSVVQEQVKEVEESMEVAAN